MAAARGWDVAAYEALSAGSATRDDARTDHGMLAFAVGADRAPRLAVGLRPRAPRGGRP